MSTYQPPTIPLNIPEADPNLKDLLDAFRANILSNTNCHAVATVQAFKQATVDGAPNGMYTIDATINYSRTYYAQQADGSYLTQQQQYPPIIDMPAIILGGGSTALTFPIQIGDQCLILFNDKDLNNWFAGARSGPVATSRQHSLSDGIALVGFGQVTSLDTDHALLSNGNAKLGVPASESGTQVLIGNDVTTLGTTLKLLTTALTTFSAAVGTSTTVLQVAAAANALTAAITPVVTAINTLLE